MVHNRTVILIQALFTGLPQLPSCDDCKLPANRAGEFILVIDFGALSDFMYPVL